MERGRLLGHDESRNTKEKWPNITNKQNVEALCMDPGYSVTATDTVLWKEVAPHPLYSNSRT